MTAVSGSDAAVCVNGNTFDGGRIMDKNQINL